MLQSHWTAEVSYGEQCPLPFGSTGNLSSTAAVLCHRWQSHAGSVSKVSAGRKFRCREELRRIQ